MGILHTRGVVGGAITAVMGLSGAARADTIAADPTNFEALLSELQPGDTLALESGTYTGNLDIASLRGTAEAPITISLDTGGSLDRCSARCGGIQSQRAPL